MRIGVVVGDDDMVELVVPALLPFAEVVPEVLRVAGLLHPDLVHLGFRIELPDGSPLVPNLALRHQGVRAGTVLVIRSPGDEARRSRYDDVLPPPHRRFPGRLAVRWLRRRAP